MERLLSDINNQLFIVTYLSVTDTKPKRFRIRDTRFKVSQVFSFDDIYRTCDHHAREILEGRGFNIIGYATDDKRGYFFTRDFRALNAPAEPAPAAKPAPTPTPYDSKTGNFRAYHAGHDKNGNSIVKIKPSLEQYRAFSIQRQALGHISAQTKGAEITSEYEKQTIVCYIASYGTDTQKAALKIPVFEFIIQTHYGNEWENVSYDETLAAARQTLREYRANQPSHAHRIIKRRIGA